MKTLWSVTMLILIFVVTVNLRLASALNAAGKNSVRQIISVSHSNRLSCWVYS